MSISSSMTAPAATAGRGARSTRRLSNTSSPSPDAGDSSIDFGSSSCATPSAVTTRARMTGRSWYQGDHGTVVVPQARTPAEVRMRETRRCVDDLRPDSSKTIFSSSRRTWTSAPSTAGSDEVARIISPGSATNAPRLHGSSSCPAADAASTPRRTPESTEAIRPAASWTLAGVFMRV
ncbi:MAG: hypothetical protein AUH92_01360 [Acidobacteria bacterium 13_1_40CM_4_69_4]|nr:MAG: hypothetical protein AUH92_01360 [Acidobacteria bacterium 13_1_40CM_4_69_4]